MAIVAFRCIPLEATGTVADVDYPPWAGTSYYQARTIDRVLASGVEWRDALFGTV